MRVAAVNRAREELARWSVNWQPYLPDMPTHNDHVVHYANRSDNRPRIRQAFEDYAHQHAEATHPERAMIATTAAIGAPAIGIAGEFLEPGRKIRLFAIGYRPTIVLSPAYSP